MNKERIRRKGRWQSGALLIELMIAIAILIIVLVGYLQLYILCFALNETTGNSGIAISEIQGRVEEIRNHDFDSIVADYNQVPFSLSQLNGMMVCYITPVNSDLLQIEIFASWREKGSRVIGDDSDLDGIIDAAEDNDGNGRLDSPVSITTLIAKR